MSAEAAADKWPAEPLSHGDPYLQWARLTQFEGHGAAKGRGDGAVLPLLIELNDKNGAAALADNETARVRIPGIYQSANASGLSFCTGTVLAGAVCKLRTAKPPLLRRAQLSLPLAAGEIDTAAPMPIAGDPDRLVIGIIDRGCAFLNGALRRQWSGPGRSRTRIRAFWDQGHAAGGQPWLRPEGFGYGRELDATAIDMMIARVEAGETEAAVYRTYRHLVDASGRLPPHLHGTHVADTAIGLVPDRPLPGSAKPQRADAAASAELIFVSVPELGKDDTTGASTDAFVLDAIHYILHRAGNGTRVVINVSIGAQAGPHDGSSCIERAMDELIDTRRDLAIVVAAGNGRSSGSTRRNGRWQANGLLMPNVADVPARESGSVAAFVWRTLSNDVTDSFLEVWFGRHDAPDAPDTPDAATEIEVQVTAPDGRKSGWIKPGYEARRISADKIVARLACHAAGTSALGNEAMAHLALAPSAGVRRASPAGRWLIELHNRSLYPVEFDAWVQRDEPPAELDEVLQSALEEAADPGTVAIDLGCTLGSFGTALYPLVVGASRLADNSVAPYSAGAGTAPTNRANRDVDALAPADETELTYGLWAAGVSTGSIFRMSGTSVAAPVLTRVLANWLMRQPAAMPALEIRERFLDALRSLPQNASPRDPNAAPRPPVCGLGLRL